MKYLETFLKIVFYPISLILLFVIAIQLNDYLIESFKINSQKPQVEYVQPEQKPELKISKPVPSTAI